MNMFLEFKEGIFGEEFDFIREKQLRMANVHGSFLFPLQGQGKSLAT